MMSSTADDGATGTTPRIINGLTVRPSEKVSLWGTLWPYGILFMPDIVAVFALVAIGLNRLLRYLDGKHQRG